MVNHQGAQAEPSSFTQDTLLGVRPRLREALQAVFGGPRQEPVKQPHEIERVLTDELRNLNKEIVLAIHNLQALAPSAGFAMTSDPDGEVWAFREKVRNERKVEIASLKQKVAEIQGVLYPNIPPNHTDWLLPEKIFEKDDFVSHAALSWYEKGQGIGRTLPQRLEELKSLTREMFLANRAVTSLKKIDRPDFAALPPDQREGAIAKYELELVKAKFSLLQTNALTEYEFDIDTLLKSVEQKIPRAEQSPSAAFFASIKSALTRLRSNDEYIELTKLAEVKALHEDVFNLRSGLQAVLEKERSDFLNLCREQFRVFSALHYRMQGLESKSLVYLSHLSMIEPIIPREMVARLNMEFSMGIHEDNFLTFDELFTSADRNIRIMHGSQDFVKNYDDLDVRAALVPFLETIRKLNADELKVPKQAKYVSPTTVDAFMNFVKSA